MTTSTHAHKDWTDQGGHDTQQIRIGIMPESSVLLIFEMPFSDLTALGASSIGNFDQSRLQSTIPNRATRLPTLQLLVALGSLQTDLFFSVNLEKLAPSSLS